MKSSKQKRRIIVGDIHGELDGFREILRNAKLIDSQDHWIGGDDILIQTGDVIDRGPCSREAIALLRKLQQEAPGAKGEAVRLCGNHELMLLQHNFSYVNFTDPESLIAELKEEIARGDVRASYYDGERLYSHAGLRSAIRESLVDEMKSAKPKSKSDKMNLFLLSDHINRIFKESVEKNDLDLHPIFHVPSERGGNAPVGGIFWCDFSSISPSAEAWIIPQIFGHTPSRKNGLKTAHGLRLIDVDAGMCRFYGGARVYIEITPEGQLLQHSKSLSQWTTTRLCVNDAPSQTGMEIL
ncbi:MAG: metallophosphoesterase [Syntrophales bacterium]